MADRNADSSQLQFETNRLEHLNRVLQAVRNVNKLIVRASDRSKLLQGTCECLTSTRGYHKAWVALLDEERHSFSAAYESNLGQTFRPVTQRLRENRLVHCVQRAFETDRAVIVHDPPAQCGDCPLAHSYQDQVGLAAGLRIEGRLVGVLGASVPGAFAKDGQEQALLTELAEDLAYALHSLEMDQQRTRWQESMERSNLILESSPSVVFQWKARDGWPVEYVSQNVTQFGYTPEDFLSGRLPYRSIIHGDDLPRVLREVRQHTQGPAERFRQEYRILDRSGAVRWVEDYTTVQRGEYGAVEALRGVVTDITQRKESEQALRESEARYRALVEQTGDCLLVHNFQAELLDVNDFACRKYGYTREELLDMKVSDLDPDYNQRENHGAFWRGLKLYEPVVFEARQKKKSGEIFPVEVRLSLIRYRSQTVVMGMCRDISQRKQAQEALRTSEQRYRTLAESFPDGALFLFDTDLRYVSADGRELAKVGLQPDRIVGRTMAETFPELVDTIVPAAQSVLKGQTAHYEVEFRGNVYSNVLTPITDPDGTIRSGLAIVRNITDQKQMQEKVRHLEKMEAIGRLAGGVAHDFNNMLTVVLGNLELAREERGIPEPVRVCLSEIQGAAERSADLTRQLLAFARKQTIDPRVLDLNETIDGMLNMFRRLIGEDIDLAWIPAPTVWPVRIDPGQIDQLLANLCLNARDAIGGVGKLTIETGNIAFDEAYCRKHTGFVPGDYVQIAVSDNGCGMDEATREKIFEPFFTTKDEGRGTGLGLATVYGIVRQNDGFINVYSEPGEGTTFRIYLPRYAESALPTVASIDADPPAGGDETVLLVEDEPSILRLTRSMLESLGYHVLSAANPVKALEQADRRKGRIDLIVTDVVMPDMNGRELVGRLVESCPDLRTLYTSGYTANVIAHHGVLDEGVNFLQKPFSREQLGRMIRRILDEES